MKPRLRRCQRLDLLHVARRGVCTCPTLMREVSAFVYADEPAFFADPFFQKDADPASY